MTPLKSLSPARILILAAIISLSSLSCKKAGYWVLPPAKNIVPIPPAQLKWVQLADLPFPDLTPGDVPLARIEQQGFAIGSKGYFCGGHAITSFTLPQEMKDLWEYDATTNVWTQRASFPGPLVELATNFVIGNMAYIVVGNQTWAYAQASNTWTQKANFPGHSRSHASSFAINGKGYVCFGGDLDAADANLDDVWQYDQLTDTWSRKATFANAARQDAISFVINGRGYVCSGQKFTNPGSIDLTDLHAYNPATNTWTTRASLPTTGRSNAVGFSCIGRGFIATGSSISLILKDCWEYNANTNNWISLPNVGGSVRDFAGGFVIGNNLYIAGGIGPIPSDGFIDFWTLKLAN